MKILVLNRGSSTLKFHLYAIYSSNGEAIDPLWEARLEWKNDDEQSTLTIKNSNGEILSEILQQGQNGLQYLVKCLYSGKTAVLASLEEVDVIGHRVVHGGKGYTQSVLIDEEVKKNIRQLTDLAPLHNSAALKGIEDFSLLFKGKPQVAVFDTAFHRCLPQSIVVYPGPYKWFEEGIQRYGFHGISFQYCSTRAAKILNTPLDALKMVICHLGSGASLCAIKNGESIDTTMGFTPLEGLMMDTRSGSVDPGILLYLLEKKKSTVEELSKDLYENSGLLGLSGTSSDMRDILEQASKGVERAKLALEVYLHRLSTLIGSMVTSLNGMNVLVFTAGIGEHSSLIRKRVCDALSFLGVRLDEEKNNKQSQMDCDLSAVDSSCKILLIHTREEFEIARECWKILSHSE